MSMPQWVGVFAILVLAAPAIGGPQAEQTFSLPGAVLLFGDYNELRVVTPDATETLRPPADVGANRGYFAFPAISPRGHAIAWGFATAWRAERPANRARFAVGLYSLANRTWKTYGDFDDIGDVALSADGSRAAFVARDRGKQVLRIVDTTSGMLTEGPYKRGMQVHSYLSWAPDGTRLATEISEAGKKPVVGVIDLKTENLVVLGDGSQPRWSPTGQWIAYFANHERCVLVRPDGTGANQVAELDPSREFIVGSPVWSPDGTEILLNVSKDDRRLLDVVLLDLASHRMTTKSQGGLPVFGWASLPSGKSASQ